MEEVFEATEDDALTAQLENGQQTRDHLGHLYLHYNEESDQDKRPPFFVKVIIIRNENIQYNNASKFYFTKILFFPKICWWMFDQINELADTYPALMTLKSTDICPDSWVAVAWYVFVYW